MAKNVLWPAITVLNDTLQELGYQSMGPMSKAGLPIYLGRYVDRNTKRLRLIGRPNKVQVNPLNW